MEWHDDGILLSVRKHGETAAIATLLTHGHGRHAGLVRGGAGRRMRGTLQPGNRLSAHWRGRLPEHLGTLTVELAAAHAAPAMADPARLAALTSACALIEAALPEREAHPALFEATEVLMTALETDDWPTVYVTWELGLLAELGYGLDLSKCAATGRNDQLAYVSPKSGRAVSLAAGEPYHDKLLLLPPFLLEPARPATASELHDALKLTAHFLEAHVFADREKGLPPARKRLAHRLRPPADIA